MLRQLIYGVMLCIMPTAVYGQYTPNYPPPNYPPVIIQPQVPQVQPYYYPAPVQPRLYYPAPHQDYYQPVPEDELPAQPQQPQYRPNKSPGLGYKCAQASEYIKNNNCGPQGCNVGLCVALQNGCHIQWWGHTPDCSHTQR